VRCGAGNLARSRLSRRLLNRESGGGLTDLVLCSFPPTEPLTPNHVRCGATNLAAAPRVAVYRAATREGAESAFCVLRSAFWRSVFWIPHSPPARLPRSSLRRRRAFPFRFFTFPFHPSPSLCYELYPEACQITNPRAPRSRSPSLHPRKRINLPNPALEPSSAANSVLTLSENLDREDE
jgi:hypothetical protein